MRVVLTICSANYLAHAKVLGDSLARSNPDYQFVIGLVDRVPEEINFDNWLHYEVIPVEDLGIPEFPDMAEKYNLIELNTAVKPIYLEYLYRRNPSVEAVLYIDPDILVLGSFRAMEEKLLDNNIILTPHSCTYDDSSTNLQYEISMLCTGIYNLGFIATARSETTFAFLKWWRKRLVDYCYIQAGSGMFVDQLWVTLAPLYFNRIYVEKDPGYNMCYWNHFERQLGRHENRYLVNGKHELVFYHFSSYNPLKPGIIANRCLGQTFDRRPDLKPLYDDYSKLLLEAGYVSVSRLECAFRRQPKPSRRTVKTVIQCALKRALRVTPNILQKPLRRVTRFIADNCGD